MVTTNPFPLDAGKTETASLSLLERFQKYRRFSELIAAPLSPEDCVVQSMSDASPTRWHLAHTTWFFETFLLKPLCNYQVFDGSFEYLFNSYYNSVGKQYPRDKRGLITRPALAEIFEYRKAVDERVSELIDRGGLDEQQMKIIRIGLNHEQQHQELMLTDIKHMLWCNPLFPAYQEASSRRQSEASLTEWKQIDEGMAEIGVRMSDTVFDNETPRHRTFLHAHEIADRCVTNREYLRFIEDGGYKDPQWWLSMGWAHVQEHNWQHPLYWIDDEDEGWSHFTLAGQQPLLLDEPVCHVSYFEADAFARWSGHRLPTEAEWEVTAREMSVPGTGSDDLVMNDQTVHPVGSKPDFFGNLWQWTSNQYTAYPGYHPVDGALGEYNGKFMCNQFVLRGGSCATPSGHIRPSYRNFFPPQARWQFSGIRLAKR